ncbi:MAG: hypothetical protein IH624_06710 [Phycisphaerae bacterium]|nr:hypothetical protein [Phycisphaerae bacterium]
MRQEIKIVVVAWIAAAAVLAGAYRFVLAPQTQEKTGLETELHAKTEKAAGLEIYRTPAAQARLIAAVEALRRQRNGFLFAPGDLSLLDFRLQDLARRHRLTEFANRVVAGAPAKPDPKMTVQSRHYLMSFSGEFASALQFVNELERHNPVLFVDTIRIRKDYGRDKVPQVEVEVTALYSSAIEDPQLLPAILE